MIASSQVSSLWSAPTVDFGNAVITVFAGIDQIKFVLHKDLTCKCSKFFAKALQGEFNEVDNEDHRAARAKPQRKKQTQTRISRARRASVTPSAESPEADQGEDDDAEVEGDGEDE
jgi:hypothetical protein